MSSVYFGGSRHARNINTAQVAQVVGAVITAGHSLHVGCQFGADAQVITAWLSSRQAHTQNLHMFAVGQNPPPWFKAPQTLGAQVTLSAGGTSAPIHARYLLRSIAAFQGCQSAVFFSPGAGSLAVAREALRAGLPVFAFQQAKPAPVPSSVGAWVPSSFHGFACWQWQAPAQLSFF